MRLFIRTFILLIISLFALTGCKTLLPKTEIQTVTPKQAKSWAEHNKDNDNARLFIVHSENMRGFVRFLVGAGVDVPWIKESKSSKQQD